MYGKGEMKTIVLNFLKYPFQMVFAAIVLMIAQSCGLFLRGIDFIFSRKQIL